MVIRSWRTARQRTALLALALLLGGVPVSAAAMQEIGCPASAPSQVKPAARRADRLTLKEAGRESLSDAGRIWSSPARIRRKDILPLLGFAAATGLLIAADEPIRDHVQTYASLHPWVGDISSVVTQMGQTGAAITAGAFFGVGLAFKDDRARDTGYLSAEALLQAYILYNALKGLTGRQRPLAANGQDHWSGPVGFIKMFDKSRAAFYTAFPSGHTASAFSIATVVAMEYRHSGWVPALAYTIAGGVGLSRIGLDKHWASDVLVGAVLGHFVGRLVVRNHERRSRLVPMAVCTGRAFAFSLLYDLGPSGD